MYGDGRVHGVVPDTGIAEDALGGPGSVPVALGDQPIGPLNTSVTSNLRAATSSKALQQN